MYESAVTSSLLYAKKNSPNKQSILLEIPPDSSSSEVEDDQVAQEREASTSIAILKAEKKEQRIKPQSLQDFCPEIPPAKEEKPTKKKLSKKKPKSKSKTKQLLLEALGSSKQQLQVNKVKKKISAKPRMTKKQRKEYELKKTIKLTRFIPENFETPIQSSPKTQIRKSSDSPLFEETDPYPFSTLIEWLIWHNNFPELAYVREAYDLDSVPQDSDELYWINVMNEPEFFTSNWKIAGSRIYDLEGIRTRGPPGGEPDFNLDFDLTENGFSTLFSDVHMILTKLPNGLRNLRYPILQLALKGLLLLELVYLDENLRWFALGSNTELRTRLSLLDSFIGEQESRSEYEDNLRKLVNAKAWQKGVIAFDLLIMKSMFLSNFSRTQISEEIKLEALKNVKLQKEVIPRLNEVDHLDKLRVRNLVGKLSN